MDIKFTVDKDKLKQNNADGVNMMFNEMTFKYCYGGALGIINEFMLEFGDNSDIETYVIEDDVAKEIGQFILDYRQNLEEQLNSIILDRGYDLQSEIILEKTLYNIENKIQRYGMNLTFETIIA